jgi:hypothetical protein
VRDRFGGVTSVALLVLLRREEDPSLVVVVVDEVEFARIRSDAMGSPSGTERGGDTHLFWTGGGALLAMACMLFFLAICS